MKQTHSILLAVVALAASPIIALAQDNPPPGGPGGRGGNRPPSPLMAALDANKDGEIDAAEMAKAPEALKTLDKNGDGKLSGDEIRPARGNRVRVVDPGAGGEDKPK